MSVSPARSASSTAVFNGFEEEGEIMINIEKVVYIENIKDYNDERINNEVRDLVKLDFQKFFGRMYFYNQYLKNIVKSLRDAIQHSFRTGDESIYTPIKHAVNFLIQVDPVSLVETADGTQLLTDYLQKRTLLYMNGDSPMVIEARAIKHCRPFNQNTNIDSKWFITLPHDTDCLAVNEENKVIRPVRVMSSTTWHTDTGPYSVDGGDKVAFKGIMYYGQIDGDRKRSAVFNVDEYIDNVHKLKVGDQVNIIFNTGPPPSNGVVRHIEGNLMRIEVENDSHTVVDFCIHDLTVNNCFVYGQEYTGQKYNKRMLFNQNWMFVLEDEFIQPSVLMSIVFPTVSEGITIFPELSHVTSLAVAEKVLGGEYKGRDNYTALSIAIGNKVRDLRKIKKKLMPQVPKTGSRFSLSPGLEFLHFHKNAKTLSKYFGPYVMTDTFVDGDQSRFEHISRNPHLLYAYCLNLLYKNYTVVPKIQNVQVNDATDAFESDVDVPSSSSSSSVGYTNIREMFSQKAEDGSTSILFLPGRVPCVYKMLDGMWVNQSTPSAKYNENMVVLPGHKKAIDLNAMDANTRREAAIAVSKRATHIRNNEDDLKTDLMNDINTHMMLGKFKNVGKNIRELQHSEDVDYREMAGMDEDPDVDDLLNNQENFGDAYAPIIEDEQAPLFDFELGQMLQEPIGVVFVLFIEMFGINIEGDDLKVMMYNVSKYKSFDDLKTRLRDKERALKAQVQHMKRQNTSIDKVAIDNLIKQRLVTEENAFMSEYYGQVVSMACAFIILYVQHNLPSVKFRPFATVGTCNKHFSYMGYPIDNNASKSLIKYLACVLGVVGPTSGKGMPLFLAHGYFKSHDLESMIKEHIDSVLSSKPHYQARINQARKRMSQRVSTTTGTSRLFYGFRPSPDSVRERYPDIHLDDMLMYRTAEGAGYKVNACCMVDIDTLKERVANKAQNLVNHTAVKAIKEPNTVVKNNGVLEEDIVMENAHVLHASDGSLDVLDLNDVVKEFMTTNTLFTDDRHLMDIVNQVGDDAWNALSAHVTLQWQLLTHAIKASQSQQETWFEAFVRQEKRYRNPSEVKAVFEKVTSTTIPAVLGRTVNNYLVDTRHIDKKNYVSSEHRGVIKDLLLDKESEFLMTLVQQDEDRGVYKLLHQIVNGSFKNIKAIGNISGIYRIILLYNYILVKVFYMLMHASTGIQLPDEVFDTTVFEMLYMTTPRVRVMAEFVRMLLDKICRSLEINHIDTDKICTEFEKQREHVKQDLMRKMEKFSKEEKVAFRVLKEKTGITNEYLDQIQAQAAALIEMMNHHTELGDTNDDPDPQDQEDIPMDWAGENPDDDELEDDGSGY